MDEPMTLDTIRDQIGPVVAWANVEFGLDVVLVKRRKCVFPERPYVTWELNTKGLFSGHYDLTKEQGFASFCRRCKSIVNKDPVFTTLDDYLDAEMEKKAGC